MMDRAAEQVPRIFFRVDGSVQIGTGHVMRCLTLADALRRYGMVCHFLSRTLDQGLVGKILAAGHDVTFLPETADAPPEASQGEYGLWLGTTQQRDAADTIAMLNGLSSDDGLVLIVVDHYGLDAEWEELVRAHHAVPMLAFDDLSRSHQADIVLDATFNKSAEAYHGLVSADCICLIGSGYALLRPEFQQMRLSVLEQRDADYVAGKDVAHVLIAMGGGDPDDATGWIVDALADAAQERGFTLHVLVGASYPHREALRMRTEQLDFLTIHHNISDVASLMARMDLCIGASGTSTWERCCLGLPTINMVLANNQRTIATELSRYGAIVDGGDFDPSLNQVEWRTRSFDPCLSVQARSEMSRRSRETVDGRGVERVIAACFSTRLRTGKLVLRPACPDDSELLYAWQCAPGTRKYAVNPAIPSWEQHSAWMATKLNDEACSFYIACVDGIPCGVVRLDLSDAPPPLALSEPSKAWREISILTAPEFYGCGIAFRSLERLKEIHGDEALVAHILPGNEASHRLFVSSGFDCYAPGYWWWSQQESSATDHEAI